VSSLLLRPAPSPLADRAVAVVDGRLAGARVALLVTGGIAAMKAPLLARELRRSGATVVAFLSDEALRYVGEDALAWACTAPVVRTLSPQAEHLGDEAPFDAYLVAPATYNTLGKMAGGIADTPITATLAAALGRLERGEAAVLVAPTMNGRMHTAILDDNLARLRALGVTVIPSKAADGKHLLPDLPVLVAAVARSLARGPLVGQEVVLHGEGALPGVGGALGPALRPRALDFGHRLALSVWCAGAALRFVQDAALPPPPLPVEPTPAAPGDPPPLHLRVGSAPAEALEPLLAAKGPAAALDALGQRYGFAPAPK